MGLKLTNIRKNYLKSKLLEENLPKIPFSLFEKWYQDAVDNEEDEPNAMVLATVFQLRPSARVVLLKEMTDQSFLFFTNYASRKGLEIELNPFVSLTFFWPKCERQIRIEGVVEKTTDEISEEYFNSRPFESRVGAVISAQSQRVDSKQNLENKFFDFVKSDQTPIRPSHWGGYRCIPDQIEFWQGGEHRLHDRIRYRLENGNWIIERLSP
jgi:pyridoxamine 5'-phosphate oxidase